MNNTVKELKPLTLKHYPPLGPEPSEWKAGRGGVLAWRSNMVRECQARESRRFSNAEFAAEFYRLQVYAVHNPFDTLYRDQMVVLQRFIDLPSIHENVEG